MEADVGMGSNSSVLRWDYDVHFKINFCRTQTMTFFLGFVALAPVHHFLPVFSRLSQLNEFAIRRT